MVRAASANSGCRAEYRRLPGLSRLDFDPVAALLVYGVPVAVEERIESGIGLHDLLCHQLINIVCRLRKDSRRPSISGLELLVQVPRPAGGIPW